MPVDEQTSAFTPASGVGLPAARPIVHTPVTSVIRPQLWVHWTITVLCLAAWGGMMYLGDLAERTDFGLRDILGLRSGRVTNFFSTLMLLWAGQLSLLIYWYRRKSRNDFAGRYRMWLWICGMLQFFLVVTATGAHRPFSQYMLRRWPLGLPMYHLLSWLVPVATLSLAMYRLLRIELKRHRSGTLLLNVAGLSAVVAGSSLVIGPLLPSRLRDLLEIGSATLAHLALATALLMHARYVVHISNEVPRRQPASRRAAAALRSLAGYLPLPSFRMPQIPVRRLGGAVLSRLRRPDVALPKLSSIRGPWKGFLPRLSLPKLTSIPLPPRRRARPPASAVATPGSVATSGRTQRPAGGTPRVAPPPAAEAAVVKPAAAPVVQTRAVLRSRKSPSPEPPAAADRHRVDLAEAPRGPRRAAAPAPAPASAPVVQEPADDFQGDAGDSDMTRGLSKKQRRKLRKLQRSGR